MGKRRRPILMGEAERAITQTEPVCPAVLTRRTIELASRRPADDRAVSITAKCHPSAGVKVWYQASIGQILLVCAQCDAPSAWIQVASELAS